MKSLESIYESILLENQNPNNIDLKLLKKCIRGTYTINDDGSIDVEGDVDLSRKKLTKIPFNFGKVSGNFRCYDNQLASLEGSPNNVGGNFYCSNNKLKYLEGAPTTVGGHFYCYNNKLTSLEGAPTTVGGSFYCSDNLLQSLEGAPTTVGDFYCSSNKLTALKGAPNTVDDFYCHDNQLKSLEGAPTTVGGMLDCTNNPDLPYSELFKIVDNIKGDIYYSLYNTPEDKDKIRRDRDIKETLKDDELGNLDV